jgi:threonylcarbamoyladenosine tRNA methylthiotransferase MtaB
MVWFPWLVVPALQPGSRQTPQLLSPNFTRFDMKVRIETHGCKLNAADSQQLAREFSAAGFMLVGPDLLDGTGKDSAPDVFVLNSCTVTSVADRKARQSLSAARRRFPDALIVATGCYAERDIDAVNAVDAVDIALGNRNKPEIVKAVVDQLGVAFIPQERPTSLVHGSQMALPGRTRASVKIQEGCDQVCAYCIVPKVRGRERSVSVGEIVGQVQQLVLEGCSEVVLTGTQLGTYGFDLESASLPSLLRTVVGETDVQRIRVSSLQPLEISDELLAVWADVGDRLCPHFHISLQSGSDAVLGRMRRRYTAAQFVDAVARVREAVPGCSVTTDVICGFPGETDEDHDATLATIENVRFADAHVFPYSVRPGTSAAHASDHVGSRGKSDRAAEVRALTETHALEFKEHSVGQVRPVLWEGASATSGLTDNYLRVRTASQERQTTTPNQCGERPLRKAGLIELVRLTGIAPDGSMTVELFD